MKSNKDKLIKELGKKDKLSDNHVKSEKKFIGSAVFVDEIKKKNIYGYPTRPDSVELAIKRARLQRFTWLHCCEQNIQLDPEVFGGKFTGSK